MFQLYDILTFLQLLWYDVLFSASFRNQSKLSDLLRTDCLPLFKKTLITLPFNSDSITCATVLLLDEGLVSRGPRFESGSVHFFFFFLCVSFQGSSIKEPKTKETYGINMETISLMMYLFNWLLNIFVRSCYVCRCFMTAILNAIASFVSVNHIGAPSSEFVSSSIPSWQILTAHAQPFRGARDLAFCLKVPLDSLLVWASSGGSGETARMRRLAWTFAARIGDKYQIRLTRSILFPITLYHVIIVLSYNMLVRATSIFPAVWKR